MIAENIDNIIAELLDIILNFESNEVLLATNGLSKIVKMNT